MFHSLGHALQGRALRPEHGLDPEKGGVHPQKAGPGPKHHYNFYTHSDWGRAEHYSITLDSGVLGVPKCVELICCAAR